MTQLTTDLKEIVTLGAVDGLVFYKAFFPKTTRMGFAPCHREISDLLDNPHARQVNLRVARGWAKTSFLRMFMSRRIAYKLSNTILYIGASEGHAFRSVRWLKMQVERNAAFARTFGLKKGKTWQDGNLEIRQRLPGQAEDTIFWVLGVGITGSVRGINFDDFRPDLIIIDDVLTDENAATDEQREKLVNLILGAIRESLAPATENPDAKLVMLQTPLHLQDASSIALSSPDWASAVFGCWTLETQDLPLELRRSSWEERYPTPTLQAEAKAAIATNRYSIFAREKECRLITGERAKFRQETIKYWNLDGAKPPRGTIVIAVDPVPPPSEQQIAKNLQDKDFEAVSVVMRAEGKYYLLAYAQSKGHNPVWTCETVLSFHRMFTAQRVVIEAVAYQRVLSNIVSAYLIRHHVFLPVKPLVDRRSKYNRIIGALADVSAAGRLLCSSEHVDFIADFAAYPDVQHDDLLDSVSMGVADLLAPYEDAENDEFFSGALNDAFNRPLNIRRAVP